MNVDTTTARVTAALREAATKLAEIEQRKREPIAIVAMACRFPGGATSPEAFWQNLIDETDALVEIPRDRFDVRALFNEDPARPGSIYVKKAHLLRDAASFDAQFFNISPREAMMMDPQQRLLMELSWEALERAAIVPATIKGSTTGVFIGAMNQEYSDRIDRPDRFDAHSASGNLSSALAGRLSFFYGLHGPSVVIDSACSSSLVAIHQAIQSLRLEESSLALAGGVHVMCSPKFTLAECRARMLSADGRCKSFDASADGYARGEGGAIMVLKRLRDAVRDSDPVIAVIRGSAVNHDGRSAGLTVPNGAAQTAVIEAALKQAGCAPEDIHYVEAHGTGTSLGDPIEVRALAKAYKTADREPLLVGTVKTNIGHLEGAAGIAGVCKTVLALQHATLPATLHLRTLTPHVDWEGVHVEVVRSKREWPAGRDVRRAGCSSFGFAGTNAHVVIEQAPPLDDSIVLESSHRDLLLTVSAKSQAALTACLEQYVRSLELLDESLLQSFCFTANTARTPFSYRVALVGRSKEELLQRLRDEVQRLGRDTLLEVQPRDEVFRSQSAKSLADAYLAGSPIAWDTYYEGCPGRRLVIPTYPFERARYWLDETVANISLHREPPAGDANVVDSYYSALSFSDASLEGGKTGAENDERYLTFGPIAEKIPGFSWILAQAFPEQYPEFVERIVLAQREMRELLFGEVDFNRVERVLDFGCGYGTDLRHLAKKFAHISCCGYTISQGQAQVGTERVRSLGLEDRISIYNRDSAVDPFPGTFDLAFGFEVVHHVPNKGELFRNVGESLRDGGTVVLADFISRTRFAIEHDETSSFFSTPDEWCQLLSANGLEIVELVDISPEVSNFLHDPDFEENLTRARHTNDDAYVDAAIRSYHQLGKLFARGLASYTLFRIQKKPGASREQVSSINRHWLSNPKSYAEKALQNLTYQVTWEKRQTHEGLALESLAVWHFGCSDSAGLISGVSEIARVSEVRIDDNSVIDSHSLSGCTAVLVPSGADEDCIMAVLRAVQGVVSQPDARLLIVTRNALENENHLISPRAASAWGLVRSALEEYPSAALSIVEFEVPFTKEHLTTLIRLPARGQFKISADGVSQPVLTRCIPEKGGDLGINGEATYVVAGGSGGLGAEIVQWLVDRGARYVVVLGRSGKGPSLSSSKRTTDIVIRSIAANVAEPRQLRDAVAEIRSSMPPVGAVVHCAGVLDDAPLLELTPDRMSLVGDPKIRGAENLHHEFGADRSVLWIHISSMTALLGGRGQGNYAAANSYVDAFSAWQRAKGCRSYSIQYGPLRELGMTAGEAGRHRFESRGVIPLSAQRAISVLERIVASDPATVGVVDVDWKMFRRRYPDPESSMIGRFGVAVDREPLSGDRPSALFSPGMSRDQRMRIVSSHVQKLVAKVLGLETSQVGMQKGFFDLGMDSLIAVDLRNELMKLLGGDGQSGGAPLSIPATVLFTYPTVAELSAYVVDSLNERVPESKVEVSRSEYGAAANDSEVWSQIERALEGLEAIL